MIVPSLILGIFTALLGALDDFPFNDCPYPANRLVATEKYTVDMYTRQPFHCRIRMGESQDEWLDILETGDEDEKLIAVMNLLESHNPRVVEAFIRVFQDKSQAG